MEMVAVAKTVLILGLVLEFTLVITLLAKRRWRRYPIFTAYACCVLAENVAAYTLYRNVGLYSYVYLIGESFTILLGLGVAYEIFGDIFSAQPALKRIAISVFQISAIGLVILSVAVLYYHSSFRVSAFGTALRVAEEAARIIEIGAIAFLFLFSGAFGLHWKQSTFGIAFGLGVFVATKLAVITSLPYVSKTIASTLWMISSASFDISLLIWLGYLLMPERVPETAELPQHSQLEQWNQAILELIHQ